MVQGKFTLDKVLKDGRKSPKSFVIPEDKDILVYDQHRQKLPDGRVIEAKTRTLGILKKAWQDDNHLHFNWKITNQDVLNLASEAKHPEKLFMYSPEHFPVDKNKDYPQGQIGKLDGMAVTNLPNDAESITEKIFNSLANLVNNKEEDPLVIDKGDKMEDEKIKELIQNSITDIDFKGMIEAAMAEKLEVVDELQQNIEKIDFTKINDSLTKLEELEGKVQGIVQNMSKQKDSLIKAIVEGSEFEKEELEQFSEDKLQKLADRFEIKMDGLGEGVVQNNAETPESRFVAKFGVKIEDLK